MKLKAKRSRPPADWQLPLINIVFLMLLFFVVNGTISNIRDAAITLPNSVSVADSGPVGDAAYLDAEGRLTFRGKEMTATEIAAIWLGANDKDAGSGPPGRLFQVAADRSLQAQLLIAKLQEFRAAGLRNISLVTLRGEAHVE